MLALPREYVSTQYDKSILKNGDNNKHKRLTYIIYIKEVLKRINTVSVPVYRNFASLNFVQLCQNWQKKLHSLIRIQLNLQYATTHNVKPKWSITRGGRSCEYEMIMAFTPPLLTICHLASLVALSFSLNKK